jgi:hypothetical protein
MGIHIGIIGLPNVGKSTTFNALTKEQNAEVANYPFCTIQPNRAVVPVPDDRADRLAELVGLSRVVHATVEFVDIAGLVKGASKGEGLGNQFLAQIRNTDAIVHVVRCFEDVNVAHVNEQIDPRDDIETVNLELILADQEQLERKIERLSRQVKGDKKIQPTLDLAIALKTHLDLGRPIASFERPHLDAFHQLDREMRFLTNKPVIYIANVDESDLVRDSQMVMEVRQVAAEQGAEVVKLCARLEEEIAGLTEEDQRDFLQLAGVEQSGLEKVVWKSYRMLDLISFFSMNEEEVRAWTIPSGTIARKAAGVIHSDFERGFIRAEVIPYETFVRHGSAAAVKAAGEMRLEGKAYEVKDGDVIYFRFNV